MSRLLDRLEVVLADNLLLSASLLFMPILYGVGAFGLITQIGLGSWVFPFAVLLFVLVIFALHRGDGFRKLLLFLSLFFLVFAVTAWFSSHVIDNSWDGRRYHAAALLSLLSGGNPFYGTLEGVGYDYPAAYWFMSSSFILWTSSFEASFVFTGVAIFGAFVSSWRFIALLSGVSRGWRLVLSALLACNPQAISNLFMNQVDGLLVSVLLSVFMLLLSFFGRDSASDSAFLGKEKRGKLYDIPYRLHALYIVSSLVLLINLKFSGFLYGGILGFVALCYGLTRDRTAELGKRLFRLVGVGVVGVILGFFVFGYFPYVKNTIEKGNPFHSAYVYDDEGSRVGNVVSRHFDSKFYDMSHYEKWWISLFSKSGDKWTDSEPLAPFSSLTPHSFGGGFGSLFSGSMLLCLTLVFFIHNRGGWLVILGVFASILSTEVSFLSRLSPQNWWLPLLFMLFYFASENKYRFRKEGFSLQRDALAQKLITKLITRTIAICLLWISMSTFLNHARENVSTSRVIADLEREGGWYITRDIDTDIYPIYTDAFFSYYASGLSSIGLPSLAKCPTGSLRRVIFFGFVVCRP